MQFFLIIGIILILLSPVFAETTIHVDINSSGETHIKQTTNNKTVEINSTGEFHYESDSSGNQTEIKVSTDGQGTAKINATGNYEAETQTDNITETESGDDFFEKIYIFINNFFATIRFF